MAERFVHIPLSSIQNLAWQQVQCSLQWKVPADGLSRSLEGCRRVYAKHISNTYYPNKLPWIWLRERVCIAPDNFKLSTEQRIAQSASFVCLSARPLERVFLSHQSRYMQSPVFLQTALHPEP